MITSEDLAKMGTGTRHGPRYRDIRLLTAGPYANCYAYTAAMIYTVGVAISDSEDGSILARWCYETYPEAKAALDAWTGYGDPPGPWIKYKGMGGERVRWEPLGCAGWPVAAQ